MANCLDKYKITIIEEFEAVGYPPSKILIAIRKAVQSELHRLIKRKAISEVGAIDSRASINRICLDPSDLNKQIIRKPWLIPTIREVCSKLLGKKLFTVFDLAGGYHHLKLDE